MKHNYSILTSKVSYHQPFFFLDVLNLKVSFTSCKLGIRGQNWSANEKNLMQHQ